MRRFLIPALAAAFIAITAAPAQCAEGRALQNAPRRPNILFLLADDWAWPHASCLGYAAVKTPTFDRLAREGVLFRNAHCAAPSCSASRAAMLTGQWPWRLEDGVNLRGSLSTKYTVYPELLERAGYFIGLNGKGYGPGGLADRSQNAAGPNYPSFPAFLAARPQGKPFCFWFGCHKPHRPYRAGSGVRNGLDPAKVVVPPYLPDNEVVRSDICDYLAESQDFDRQAGVILAALDRIGELDDTLIVMSGDNGWPFPRSKATLYDSGTHQPLAIRWGQAPAGRTIDDFVSLADLAPTFLEAAGLAVPKNMTARSLAPLLRSAKSGRVEPQRDHVLTCMETHVPCRLLADGSLGGYPMRSILTKDFHYIRNYRADRWPAGDPPGPAASLTFDLLAKDTRAAFADVDAGPAKAWLVMHRNEPAVRPFAQRAFGKRPARELYDVRHDPYELKNVAEEPAFQETASSLDARLTAELKAMGDPRATGGGDEFDRYGQGRRLR
jgi:N-sulfoglucosamine sulfohydrolase